ncbi:hypothetical protein C8J57DRAFT_1234304 [Mycena rebaudengoi]|nr:hypothetical protein C8J57DRAFT_1234304 [Mycena rebaudengoi]
MKPTEIEWLEAAVAQKEILEDIMAASSSLFADFKKHARTLVKNLDSMVPAQKKCQKFSQLYQESNTQVFETLSQEGKKAAMAEDLQKDTFKLFKTKLQPDITARNRFLELYNAVTLFSQSPTIASKKSLVQFGPSVFMDPFWCKQALIPTACTPDLPRFFSALLQNLPIDPERQASSLLKCVSVESGTLLWGIGGN